MIELGQATVSIIPNMKGAQQTITSQLAEISGPAGLGASNIAGSSFLSGFASKLGGLSGLMSKVLPAASVAAVGKALFNVGSEFDEMTDTIIVGTGASGEALEGLRQSAMDIATTVPVSFGEAGDLVQDLNTRLGLTGDTLTELGTQIAQVGDLTGEAFDTEAFSGAMSVWGTAAEDMSGQLDTLFAVSQSTGIGMNTLTGILETAAPQMNALGYTFEDTAAMAGLLDKAGLDASGRMSKMSKALTTLAKDGEEPVDAMKRVTAEIEGYIKAGDEAAAISAASDLFGTKGATQFVAAVKSGSMSIDEFSAAMSDSSGIIAKTEEDTMSFGERVTLLKNQFKELLEPMGSAVFSGLSSVMAGLSTAFTAFSEGPGQVIGEVFNNIVEEGRKIVSIFTEAFGKTANVSSFGDAVSKVGAILRTVFSVFRPLLNGFTTLLRTVLPPLARMLGSTLGAAFRAVTSVINTVKRAIDSLKSAIDRIKSAFETFKRIVTAPFRFLSGLKIPRISITGGTAPFGIGGLGTKPSIRVTWAAKGIILDKATLIGAGEAGKEGIIPLSGEAMRPFAQAIADEMPSGGCGTTINNYITIDGAKNPEDCASRLVRQMKLEMRTA